MPSTRPVRVMSWRHQPVAVYRVAEGRYTAEEVDGRGDELLGRGLDDNNLPRRGGGAAALVLHGAGQGRSQFGAGVLGGLGDLREAFEGQLFFGRGVRSGWSVVEKDVQRAAGEVLRIGDPAARVRGSRPVPAGPRARRTASASLLRSERGLVGVSRSDTVLTEGRAQRLSEGGGHGRGLAGARQQSADDRGTDDDRVHQRSYACRESRGGDPYSRDDGDRSGLPKTLGKVGEAGMSTAPWWPVRAVVAGA